MEEYLTVFDVSHAEIAEAIDCDLLLLLWTELVLRIRVRVRT